jgi:hypothetical protein
MPKLLRDERERAGAVAAHNLICHAFRDLSTVSHYPEVIRYLDEADDITLGAVIGLVRRIIARRANGNHLSGRPASPPGLYGPP